VKDELSKCRLTYVLTNNYKGIKRKMNPKNAQMGHCWPENALICKLTLSKKFASELTQSDE
jgi:hypothetical protein